MLKDLKIPGAIFLLMAFSILKKHTCKSQNNPFHTNNNDNNNNNFKGNNSHKNSYTN